MLISEIVANKTNQASHKERIEASNLVNTLHRLVKHGQGRVVQHKYTLCKGITRFI